MFCAGSNAWRANPCAADIWSFGIMLIELASGQLFSWAATLGRIAFQRDRLGSPLVLAREALPSNDPWFDAIWQLAMQLLDSNADSRPSMALVLMSGFFTSDQHALMPSASYTPLDRKLRALSSHLDALRHSSSRLPAHITLVQSVATVVDDMVATFRNEAVSLAKAMYIAWGSNKIRKPLQEVTDLLSDSLSQPLGAPPALFQHCDEPAQVLRAYLPPAARQLSEELRAQYIAIGRILAKCLLEGVHVPLNLSAALHCVLVGEETLSDDAASCIAMLADFDPLVARQLRQLLTLHMEMAKSCWCHWALC